MWIQFEREVLVKKRRRVLKGSKKGQKGGSTRIYLKSSKQGLSINEDITCVKRGDIKGIISLKPDLFTFTPLRWTSLRVRLTPVTVRPSTLLSLTRWRKIEIRGESKVRSNYTCNEDLHD